MVTAKVDVENEIVATFEAGSFVAGVFDTEKVANKCRMISAE